MTPLYWNVKKYFPSNAPLLPSTGWRVRWMDIQEWAAPTGKKGRSYTLMGVLDRFGGRRPTSRSRPAPSGAMVSPLPQVAHEAITVHCTLSLLLVRQHADCVMTTKERGWGELGAIHVRHTHISVPSFCRPGKLWWGVRKYLVQNLPPLYPHNKRKLRLAFTREGDETKGRKEIHLKDSLEKQLKIFRILWQGESWVFSYSD